ncbi:MAG: hypothetical protein WBQ03_20995, partial [Candidatus Sulfotelmatobacter sp.]
KASDHSGGDAKFANNKRVFGTDLDGQIALALARTPHQKQFGGNQLLKLCVFGFGLVENGDVWVSVFPEGKEVFIGRLSPVSVPDKNVGAHWHFGKPRTRACVGWLNSHHALLMSQRIVLQRCEPRP